MKGTHPIHRRLLDHHLWKDKPFAKGQAWIDLVLLANHTDGKALIEGKIQVVKRGQVYRSQLTLSKRWGWSRNKVKRFLNVLVSDLMVEHQAKQHGTVITHLNYTRLHETAFAHEAPNGAPDGHQTKHQTDTKRSTYKNDKNVKNVKNDVCGPQIENLLSQFPPKINALINEYLELAEKENKSGKIIESKRLRLIAELYNAYNNCDQNKFEEAMKITVQKEAPNINYIKAVYRGIEKKEGVGQKTRKEENEKEWKNGVRKGDNLYKRSQEYIKSIQGE